MRKVLVAVVAALALALGGTGATSAMAFSGGGHGGGGHFGGGHVSAGGGGHWGGGAGHWGGGAARWNGGGGHWGGGGWHGGGWHGGGWHGGHGHGGGVDFVFGVGPWWGPYYPYYYPYSYPYPAPTVVYSEPEAVIDAPAPPQYWYYCNDPSGYYPYVKHCSAGWTRVAPTPAPEE